MSKALVKATGRAVAKAMGAGAVAVVLGLGAVTLGTTALSIGGGLGGVGGWFDSWGIWDAEGDSTTPGTVCSAPSAPTVTAANVTDSSVTAQGNAFSGNCTSGSDTHVSSDWWVTQDTGTADDTVASAFGSDSLTSFMNLATALAASTEYVLWGRYTGSVGGTSVAGVDTFTTQAGGAPSVPDTACYDNFSDSTVAPFNYPWGSPKTLTFPLDPTGTAPTTRVADLNMIASGSGSFDNAFYCNGALTTFGDTIYQRGSYNFWFSDTAVVANNRKISDFFDRLGGGVRFVLNVQTADIRYSVVDCRTGSESERASGSTGLTMPLDSSWATIESTIYQNTGQGVVDGGFRVVHVEANDTFELANVGAWVDTINCSGTNLNQGAWGTQLSFSGDNFVERRLVYEPIQAYGGQPWN